MLNAIKKTNLKHYPKYGAKQIAEESVAVLGKKYRVVLKCQDFGTGEGFSTSFAAGTLTIEAESPIAAAYGVNQLEAGLKSGHIAEFLGERHPHCALRPLYVQKKMKDHHAVCRRAIEMGYNAIVTDENLSRELFHDYGLFLILKVNPQHFYCPVDPEFRESLNFDQFQADYLLWESMLLQKEYLDHTKARDVLIAELVLVEVRAIEDELQGRMGLIFTIPTADLNDAKSQSHWILNLCNDVSNKTIIAFPAVAGDPTYDHLPLHPLWEFLRRAPDISATPFMPIVNAGCIHSGGGLWPAPSVPLLKQLASRCYRHNIIGYLALTQSIPTKGGFLDCCLWVAAQSQWDGHDPELLMDTWLLAYRPDLHHPRLLFEVRDIAVQLGRLRSLTNKNNRDSMTADDCRLIAELLLSRLQLLEKDIYVIGRRNRGNALMNYFKFFLRDAHITLLHFLQCFNVSFPNIQSINSMSSGFWMEIKQENGDGIAFLEEPLSGEEGSDQWRIYSENTI